MTTVPVGSYVCIGDDEPLQILGCDANISYNGHGERMRIMNYQQLDTWATSVSRFLTSCQERSHETT